MKIKVKEISYEQFLKIKNYKHFRPLKHSRLLNLLIRIASKKELKDVNFKYKKENVCLNTPFFWVIIIREER